MDLKTIRPVVALAVLLAAMPQAASALDRLPKSLARLEAQDFERAVEIKDDQLEPHVSFSTQQAYKRGLSVPGGAVADVHLVAQMDRATGQVAFRVWNEMTNFDAPKDLASVHYVAQGRLSAAQLPVARHWLDNCVPMEAGGRCDQRIRVAFDLPEQVVREVAASYAAGSDAVWRYRFKDSHGHDVTVGLAPAEAAGIVAAIDSFKARAS